MKAAARAVRGLSWRARVAYLGATSAPVVVTDAYGVRVLLQPCDRRSADYTLRRTDDREAFRVMDAVLRYGDVMLDVGANVGVYGIHAAKRVGATGRVFAFEPVPTTLDALRTTIAINGHTTSLPSRWRSPTGSVRCG